jgi:hypothetical protein
MRVSLLNSIPIRALPKCAPSPFTSIPIQALQPLLNSGVLITYHLEITHEQRIICYIEPRNGREQPNIRIRKSITKDILHSLLLTPFQDPLNLVQRLKQLHTVLHVHSLDGCKAGFVYTIIDIVINPRIYLINFLFQVFRQESPSWVRGFPQGSGKECVEGGVEHADYFGRFVGDYSFGFLIPEDGDGEACAIGGGCFEVEF